MRDICIVFWDVDATLLDFEASEVISLRECLQEYHVKITDEELAAYRKINRSYWERFERKEIVKQHVYMGRFVDFFALLGVSHIPIIDFNAAYQLAIGRNFVPEDGAFEACDALKKQGCRQYVVSNGSGVAQHAKLSGSGLDKYMEDIFISEEMGSEKPDPHFFALCAHRIKDYDKEHAVIIGDSLTSDMQGGNNAGIRCCWFNPRGLPLPAQLRIDYNIRSLREIPAVLK
jgi:2-haloacid dehalogenase